ncbi:MAG: S8 family serine peptidase [Acidiferrobacterales bacterium]
MFGLRVNDCAALGVAALLITWATGVAKVSAAPRDMTDAVREAIDRVCEAPQVDLEQLAIRIEGAAAIEHELLEARGAVIGWRRRLAMQGGDELRIELIAPRGQLRRVSAEHWANMAGRQQPLLLALTDPQCVIRLGRRLVYEDDHTAAVTLEHLDGTLSPTGVREPLNPPVPPGTDPAGVPVAMVDAGVNYLLDPVRARLARDDSGAILGYDYWDLDRRPFDSNPARSSFFPQRHGTKTASQFLREAPAASLVPYRYPRPDMSRMADLVADAAGNGVMIVNMSLGSNEAEEWSVFAETAEKHPEMLFIVSAGNNGRNIDQRPVFPAALALQNIVTVTSAELTGVPARGSNIGPRTVDLLVPAENLAVLDFAGRHGRASGSSYAAARVTALAARLLAQNPSWRAPELRAAIFARALRPLPGESTYVSQGFIPDPATAESRRPARDDAKLAVVSRRAFAVRDAVDHPYRYPIVTMLTMAVVLGAIALWLTANDTARSVCEKIGPKATRHTIRVAASLVPSLLFLALTLSLLPAKGATGSTYFFRPTFVYLDRTEWNFDILRFHARRSAKFLEQCGIVIPSVDVYLLEGPETFRYFREHTAKELVRRLRFAKPTVYFVRDSLQQDAYEAEAIGKGNSRTRPTLRYTVWVTERLRDPGIGLAHELVHVLMDSGRHVDLPGNLMRAQTSPDNTELTVVQCARIASAGVENGLLEQAR